MQSELRINGKRYSGLEKNRKIKWFSNPSWVMTHQDSALIAWYHIFSQLMMIPTNCFCPRIPLLGKLLLAIAAKNAASERPFSALKHVRTFFRATTGHAGLNHLMMLHVHRVRTDKTDLVTAANEFLGQREKDSSCLEICCKRYTHKVVFSLEVNSNIRIR